MVTLTDEEFYYFASCARFLDNQLQGQHPGSKVEIPVTSNMKDNAQLASALAQKKAN